MLPKVNKTHFYQIKNLFSEKVAHLSVYVSPLLAIYNKRDGPFDMPQC